MNRSRVLPTLSAALLLAGAAVRPGDAQTRPAYVRVSVASSGLQSPAPHFPLDAARHAAFTLGVRPAHRHAVELRVSHLSVETTDTRYQLGVGDPALTLGLVATPIELAWVYERAVRTDRLHARAGAGVAWVRAEDRWESDTPRERMRSDRWGASGSLGLGASVAGRTRLVIDAGYFAAEHGDSSPAPRIGLDGVRLSGGLEISF